MLSFSFLRAFGRPVWSAPHYDPEALAIASRLPHLKGSWRPEMNCCATCWPIPSCIYTAQLTGALAVLGQAAHPDVPRLRAIVKASRNAHPYIHHRLGSGFHQQICLH